MLTRSPYDRDILRLAVPALGALAAEPLYVLVDTAIVGRLGTPELGGLAVASTLILTGYTLFIFLAYGTTGTVARLLGAGLRDRAAAQGVQALWLALGIGVVLAAAGSVVASPLVGAMGAGGEVRRHALTYFRISMLGVPALTVSLAGTGYLRGLQDTRTPLLVALATAVGNGVLEVWLVFGLDWGMAGSAWSTVAAQGAGAAAYLVVVGRDVRRTGVAVRPDRRALAGLTRVSLDLLLRTAALRAALLVATAVATRIGTVEVAAHQVVFELWSFLALVLDSLAIAAQAMVGRLLGAGDGAAARAATRRMMDLGLVAGIGFALTLLLLRTVLPGIFTDDAAVVALAGFLLIHAGLLQPVNAVVFVLDGVLIGAGDLRYLAIAMAAAAGVFIPAAAAVLVLDLGVGWLWGAVALLQLARLAGLLHRWRGDRWLILGVPA